MVLPSSELLPMITLHRLKAPFFRMVSGRCGRKSPSMTGTKGNSIRPLVTHSLSTNSAAGTLLKHLEMAGRFSVTGSIRQPTLLVNSSVLLNATSGVKVAHGHVADPLSRIACIWPRVIRTHCLCEVQTKNIVNARKTQTKFLEK